MRNLFLNAIESINFPSSANFVLEDLEEGQEIPCFINGLNKINIFVGENNSGKSRFMRGIMQQPKYIISQVENTDKKIEHLIELARSFFAKVGSINANNLHIQVVIPNKTTEERLIKSVFDASPHKGFLTNNGSLRLDDKYQPIIAQIEAAYKVLFNAPNAEELRLNFSFGSDESDIANRLIANIILLYYIADTCILSGDGNPYSIYGQTLQMSKEIKVASAELAVSQIEVQSPSIIYIPILRSARNLFHRNADFANKLTEVYANTTALDYKIDTSKISIETGLDLYHKIKRTRNQIREVRKGFEYFENFLSKNFFGGKDLEIVAKDVDNVHDEHISVLIDDFESDIHMLGDGVQSLIILLYPIFMAKEGAFVFVEEPELNMHPGMQRIFVNTLLTNDYIKSKKLTIFLTTHSNHLLNTSFDFKSLISIFLFRKLKLNDKVVHSVTASHGKDIGILDSIGVINSSVFMSNCSIWIEGVTDRKYIKKYLELFIKNQTVELSIKEDIHFSFVEYAGSNLSHYIFSDEADDATPDIAKAIKGLSIANRVLLIADLDKGKEAKHERFRQQVSQQFDYYTLPVIEVENLLSTAVVKQSLPELLNIASAAIEPVQIEAETLRTASIGKYLKRQLAKQGIPTSENFAAASGTIGTYYKNKLADTAVKHITWNTMTQEAKDLAQHTFNFIVTHNRGGAVDYDFASADRG